MSVNSLTPWEKNRGHLGKCQSILQEIIWMINNWENSLQPYHITKKDEEIINCENALLKVKDMIWTSCLTMFSKYDPQTKQRRGSQSALMYVQPEMTGTKTVNRNTEVVIHESNNVPVAVHQREASHMVVVSNSPHQQIVRNLLLEWSVFLNPQFQLCLVGTLPNDGTWETSPIAVRLGPTTVKTISGTMYTLHGKMVVQEDVDVPDFILEKFRDGFPVDWKTLASKWISKAREEKCGLSGPRASTENVGVEPRIVLNDIGKKRAYTPRQASQQKGKIVAPLQKENARRETLPKRYGGSQPSTSTSRSSPLLRPAQNEQDESSEEEEEVVRGNAVMPRYSKRLLSKSLMDTTCLSDREVVAKKNANEDKIRYIKNWTVEISRRRDKYVLCGLLIDEKGNILEEWHKSAAIAERIQADIVETENGYHYRLVGPSALRSREFDFGFPLHWQNLFEKHRGRQASRQNARKSTMVDSPPVHRRSKNMSQSSAANYQVKRHTNMINRTVKHQLSKAQLTMVEAIKNGAQNRTKNESNVGKRGMDSVSLHSRQGAPMKMRKVSDEDQGQDKVTDQNDSVENVSIGETNWKKEVIKRMQSNEGVKVGEMRTVAVEQNQPKECEKIPAKPMKTVKPVRKSDDKYALGLATDDCQSENEYNIF